MSPERPEDDDFLEDEEQEEYGQRSIFATGWFRAVLVLLVLAVIAVIAVPLIGGWFEPTPPPKVTTAPLPPPVQAPAPTPTAPKVETPPPAATPTAPSTPPAAQAPSPTPPAASTPTPLPPAASAPVPKPETPAPSIPSPSPSTPTPRSAEKATPRTKAPDRTASAPSKSAATSTGSGSYWVQVGAFKETRNAEGLARTLRSEGFTVQVATVTRGEPLHVVRVGGYPDRGKATAARDELQGKGHSGFVMQGPAK